MTLARDGCDAGQSSAWEGGCLLAAAQGQEEEDARNIEASHGGYSAHCTLGEGSPDKNV